MGIKIDPTKLPSTIGVYIFLCKNRAIYIGKSVNIKARVLSHIENAKLDPKEACIIRNSDRIKTIVTDSEFKALLLESDLIQKYQPKYNARFKDDKSNLYIQITINDQYPKIYLARKPNLTEINNNLFFGPFSSTRLAEQILREIRKIFPFCGQKKLTKTACFYNKINLCNPCPNKILTITDKNIKRELTSIYLTNIRNIVKILNGHTTAVLNNFYKEVKKLVKKEQYEQAIILRNKIYRFEYLTKNRVFSSDDVSIHHNNSQAMVDLLYSLLSKYFVKLKSFNRIECYDVSNLNFREATASMVVFENGLSNKAEYRRFAIKNEKCNSDMMMLEEIVRRRFKRQSKFPNLIIVDGGLPQVRSLSYVLDILHIKVPIIGIAKHPDRLILGLPDFPTIRPANNHLGFNLVRQIRDESHRFARKYHLFIRKQKLMYTPSP